MSLNYHYDIPYKSSKIESLFSLSIRAVALQITSNLTLVQHLPPNVKSVLVSLLGRRNLLSGPVLRFLAHRDLQTVDLSGVIVKDSTVKILQGVTKLKSLQMPGNEVTTACLVELFPFLPYLEELDTSSCHQVNDSVLIQLTESCPLLRIINLGKCPNFTDKGLQYLGSSMYNVVVLDISNTKVTDKSLKALCEGPSSRKLNELHIDGCRQLTAECGRYLQAFPAISMLSFYDCPRLSSSEWFQSYGSNSQKKPLKNISFTIE